MYSSDAAKNIAYVALFSSVLSLFFLAISVSYLFMMTSTIHDNIEVRATDFKNRSDKVWTEMISLTGQPSSAVFFTRKARSSWWDKRICQGCHPLGCLTGPPGESGKGGDDGVPGTPGSPGEPGSDGFDIQLENEPELPCVICPGGPPGQR